MLSFGCGALDEILVWTVFFLVSRFRGFFLVFLVFLIFCLGFMIFTEIRDVI